MESQSGKTVIVGSIVLVAALVFAGGAMWLSGKSWNKKGEVLIMFTDVGDLKRASPVRISGVPVGKVEDIRLIKPGQVEVGISLPGTIESRIDASAYIRPSGLAGDVTLVFIPGTSPTPLPEGQVIMGVNPPGLTETFGALAKKGDTVLTNVQLLTGKDNQERIAELLVEASRTMKSTQRLLTQFSDPNKGAAVELNQTMAALRQTLAQVDSTLMSPAVVAARNQSDTLVRNLSQMTAQFRATGARLDSVLAKIQEGQGTIGKFATDTALYVQATRLTAQLDSLVKDLREHPGKIGVTVKMF